MKKFHSGFFMAFAITALMFTACQKEQQNLPAVESDASAKVSSDAKSNTFYGSQVNLGNGKIRSFYTQTHEGTPLEIGVIMSAKSMDGLSEEMGMTMLEVHHKAMSTTPFNHIMVDWNPMGHEPDPLYGVPHFDFHFYMIGMDEMASIVPGPKMEKLPPPGYMPATYFPTPGGVPNMGKHWLDANAPELNGLAFTKTFIYGSYDGKVIFYEPMITRATLMEGKSCTLPFGVPTLFSPSDKWYPTKYNYNTDSKTGDIRVSLSDFVWRNE